MHTFSDIVILHETYFCNNYNQQTFIYVHLYNKKRVVFVVYNFFRVMKRKCAIIKKGFELVIPV